MGKKSGGVYFFRKYLKSKYSGVYTGGLKKMVDKSKKKDEDNEEDEDDDEDEEEDDEDEMGE